MSDSEAFRTCPYCAAQDVPKLVVYPRLVSGSATSWKCRSCNRLLVGRPAGAPPGVVTPRSVRSGVPANGGPSPVPTSSDRAQPHRPDSDGADRPCRHRRTARGGRVTRRCRSTHPGCASRRAPTLAIAYDVTSSSPLELVEALGGRYDLVWVVEAADPSLGSWARLLPRLGRVVDVAGRGRRAGRRLARRSGRRRRDLLHRRPAGLAARLASALGLEGNPPEVVRAPHRQGGPARGARRAGPAGPPASSSSSRTTADDGLAHEWRASTVPVVVKPARGSGSRHTARVDDARGGTRHLRRVRGAGTGTGGSSRSGWVTRYRRRMRPSPTTCRWRPSPGGA